MSIIPEAAISAATANKITSGGFGVIAMGWLSNTTNIALIGLAITLLGGIWSFMAFLQKRKNESAKRKEEEEEHIARMKLLAAQTRATLGMPLPIIDTMDKGHGG